jgi:predicted nucleic acid-binding protein
VDDSDLRISAITLLELRRGWELKAQRDRSARRRAEARQKLAGLDALEWAYRHRLIPVDAAVVREWARLLGAKDKNRDDMALAATARVRGFVLVTRNVGDFRGRGVRVLDPFKRPARIESV